MSLNFLPGRPNDTRQTTCQGYWQGHTIFVYCSGNNLIILTNTFTNLQTIYLDKDCLAIDINSDNGFIAVSVDNNHVYIYKPIHQTMKYPKWLQCCQIYHDPSRINCIKWGGDNELILGSDYLSFWKVVDHFGVFKPVLLWNKRQPKPVYQIDITNNSQLIASYGKYDRTLKLWKRISISGDQVIFTLILLPHPMSITSVYWKKINYNTLNNSKKKNKNNNIQEQQQYENNYYLLYTLCSDKKLRAWLCLEDDPAHLKIQNCLTLTLNDTTRYCLILDNWIIKKIYGNSKHDKESNQGLKRFLNSDIVMFGCDKVDDDYFDVYELNYNDNIIDSIGNSNHGSLNLIHRKLQSRKLIHPSLLSSSNYRYLYFADLQPYDESNTNVSLIVHDLQGVIKQSLINLPEFLDQNFPTNNFQDSSAVVHLEHKFTGHNKSIQRLIRSSDGEALLTVTRFSENCIWTPQQLGSNGGVTLNLKNFIKTETPIKLAVIHEKGNLMICLLENNKLQVWDCPYNRKNLNNSFHNSILKSSYQIDDDDDLHTPLLMLNTPETRHNHERHFVAIIYSDGSIQGFEVSLLRGIIKVTSDSLPLIKDSENRLHKISVIDPVHPTFVSDRPLISFITKDGFVETYKAIVNYDKKHISWKISSQLNTGIQNAQCIRGSSTGKLCIVSSDCKSMSLWDLNRGILEYEESFQDQIKDIDWTSTEMGQSIVAIGFTAYSLLYTQLRYDYTNNIPSYLPIEKIDITSHTAHIIGDSIWMKNGTFVVASGNQLYIKDKLLDTSDVFTHRSIGSRKILSNDILHLNSVLNGPLPVYDPQFLIQAIYLNKIELVKEILLRLFLKLREIDFKSMDVTTHLPSDLSIASHKFLIDKSEHYPVEKFPDPYPTFDKTVGVSLTEQLTRITLPYITRHQQITLITVIEAMEEVVRYQHIMDNNGIRFLLGVKLFMSHRQSQKSLLMRDVSWALHSESKTLLLSMFDSNINTWKQAREYKIVYWLKEDQLTSKFEQIAKFEFSKEDKRDPSRCAIFYLALKKKQILLSLWKISTGHPEHQKMIKFLSNDFTQPRWRTAALKNAFVLLSKHRYMEAACFFLIGDSLKDAVNVLCKQVRDIDLAIGVCRVYEGDEGTVLGNLLSTHLLPTAVLNNDKWTVSYIYWKLRKQDVAIKSLITSAVDLENNREFVSDEKLVNKSFLVEDPALLYLYQHLRTKNIKYFLGSLELGLKNEYNVVLKSVEILCRMGCDYLASSLVKNWKFIEEPKHTVINSANDSWTHTSISKFNEEPTMTARVRPSLFDKFNSSGNSKMISSNIVNQQSKSPANLLDSFNQLPTPASSSSSSRNISDDCSLPTKSKTLLDEYTPSSRPKNLLDDYTVPNKSKNLLDDFGSQCDVNTFNKVAPSATAHSTASVKSTVSTEKKKLAAAPRNLLDDFM